jgi:hypothetical protein
MRIEPFSVERSHPQYEKLRYQYSRRIEKQIAKAIQGEWTGTGTCRDHCEFDIFLDTEYGKLALEIKTIFSESPRKDVRPNGKRQRIWLKEHPEYIPFVIAFDATIGGNFVFIKRGCSRATIESMRHVRICRIVNYLTSCLRWKISGEKRT